MAKNRGLGKGFDVLMPQGVDSVLTEQIGGRVQNLFISDIFPNPDQPRKDFDQKLLNELADSIKLHGVLQPLIVTKGSDEEYIIVAGERRWRASKLAGLDKVPVIIRTAKDLEQLEISIIENIQRVDLTPLEQASSISRLHDIFGLSFEEISKRLNKAESTVNNILRLLQLPDEAKVALQEKKITEGHARSILALKSFPEQQLELLKLIQAKGWSVRQAEQFVVAVKSDTKNTKKAQKRTNSVTPETKRLSKILNHSVSVTNMAKGGRLVIKFESDDDLASLINILSRVGE